MEFAFILLILILALATRMIYEVGYPFVRRIEFETDKINAGEGFRIIQISDYHNSNKNAWIEGRIEEERPDIIAITGDLIDMKTRDYQNSIELVKKISSQNNKVYFVRGNHEWKNKRGSSFMQELEATGIRILENESVQHELAGMSIRICGVDDYHTDHSDFEAAQNKVSEDGFSLLLSHSPDMVTRDIEIRADLTLSGHTHGGQVAFPLVGALVSPGQGLFPKFTKGLYGLCGGKSIYIDSGVGTSRLPIRLMNRSQISVIDIKGKNLME